MRRREAVGMLCFIWSLPMTGCLHNDRLTDDPDPDTETREAFIDGMAGRLEIESLEAVDGEIVCRYLTSADARHEVDSEIETIANAYVAAVQQDTTFERLIGIGWTDQGGPRWRFYVTTEWARAFRTGTIGSEEFAERVLETLEEA